MEQISSDVINSLFKELTLVAERSLKTPPERKSNADLIKAVEEIEKITYMIKLALNIEEWPSYPPERKLMRSITEGL